MSYSKEELDFFLKRSFENLVIYHRELLKRIDETGLKYNLSSEQTKRLRDLGILEYESHGYPKGLRLTLTKEARIILESLS